MTEATNERDALVKRLQSYEQADADGVMVLISRQAIDEAIAALSTPPAGEQEAVTVSDVLEPELVAIIERGKDRAQMVINETTAAICIEYRRKSAPDTRRQEEALRWYRDEAAAIATNMLAKRDGAVLASMQVLALDAGKRADSALSAQQPEGKGE